MPLVSIGQGSSISWDEYLASVRGNVPAPIQTALLLAGHACRAFSIGDACLHRSGVNVFSASAGVLAALTQADQPLPAGTVLETVVGDQEAANLLATHATRIVSPRIHAADATTAQGRDQLYAEFYADLGCQRSVQTNPMMEWVLANYLLGWSPGDRAFHPVPALDAAARARYGVDAASVATAMALVVSHGVQHPHVDAATSAANLVGGEDVRVALQTVLARIACPVMAVRRVLSEEFRDVPGLASRVVAFWHRYPLVHLGGSLYMTAPPRILTAALGLQRVFGVLEAARAVEGVPDTAASRYVGARFQAFLAEALEAAEDRALVLPEHEFRIDGNHRSADFVIADRGERVVTVVEAKIRSLRAASYYGTDPGALLVDLAERFSASLVQSVKYLRSASEAADRGRLTDAGAGAWEKIAGARRVVLLAVAPSLPAAIAGKRLRQAVWSAAEARIASDETLQSFWKDFARGHEVVWHVGDAEDLCVLAGWRTRRRIGRTLVQYVRATREQPTFSIDGALHGVLDFAAASFGTKGLALPKALDAMMRGFWTLTCRLAFGHPLEAPTAER